MRKPNAPERAFVGGALVCALAGAAAGCVDVVSLGEGSGDDTGTTTDTPTDPSIRPPIPEDDIPVVPIHCHPGPTTDVDGDGWTPQQNDCNDCNPDIGPNAVEMPTAPGRAPRDENCDGQIDEGSVVCDAALPLDEPFAVVAARALELCKLSTKGDWGIVKAVWSLPDGSPPPQIPQFAVGHGVLDGFGPNVAPRRGARLLALSSGAARQPDDPGYVDPQGFVKGYPSKSPPGINGTSPVCPEVMAGASSDAVALEVVLRVPQNVDAFAFDFNFYTHEVPDRVCTPFNDRFAALLLPAPTGQPDPNIAFDRGGNAISVNSVLIEACACAGGPPCPSQGRDYACSLGAMPLVGNGFGRDLSPSGDHGATGWLTAMAEVTRNSTITLRFAIEDAGDGHKDSTVLIDSFRWVKSPAEIPRRAIHPPER
jgi:hypothetical protein